MISRMGLVSALTCICGVAFGQTYSLTDVGVITGASQAHGMAINDNNVVCGWDFTTWYDYRAFMWEEGVVSLIPNTLGYGQAYGINEMNKVVGSMMDIFVYDCDTGAIYFILRPGNWAYGNAINNSENVAGAYYTDWTTQILKPLFYQDGVMYLLPSLGGGNAGVASGVNEADHVTGWSKAADNRYHMFWYDGVMHDCGLPEDAVSSGGNGINEADIIAGYYEISGKRHAALYDYIAGTWTTLGVLPGGDSSEALGLNDVGGVVGTATIAGGGSHAFVWDAQLGLRDLNDLIPPDTGWELNYAQGINNFGAIVGTGTYGGKLRPFVLFPEPASCPADANGDGTVDPLDVGFVQTRFGCVVGTGDTECDAADANLDNLVDPLDVGFVLSRFGACL